MDIQSHGQIHVGRSKKNKDCRVENHRFSHCQWYVPLVYDKYSGTIHPVQVNQPAPCCFRKGMTGQLVEVLMVAGYKIRTLKKAWRKISLKMAVAQRQWLSSSILPQTYMYSLLIHNPGWSHLGAVTEHQIPSGLDVHCSRQWHAGRQQWEKEVIS